MSDRPDPVTRLGPDSGARRRPTNARVYRWEWGPDDARRPGLPWIGIFLLVFGALLLIQSIFPEAQALGSVVVLAIGLAFLVRWAITRGTGSLYAGAIITALAVPGVLNAAGHRARRARAHSPSGSRSCSSPRSGPRQRRWVGLAALVRRDARAARRRSTSRTRPPAASSSRSLLIGLGG